MDRKANPEIALKKFIIELGVLEHLSIYGSKEKNEPDT